MGIEAVDLGALALDSYRRRDALPVQALHEVGNFSPTSEGRKDRCETVLKALWHG